MKAAILKFPILIFFILFPISILAQHNINVNFGYGTYSMSSMKDLQSFIKQETEIGLEIVESFPAYLNYSAGYGFGHGKNMYGSIIRFASTGGRLSYSDYSGSYNNDQLLRLFSFGLNYKRLIFDKKIRVNFSASIFYNYTSLMLKSSLIIYDEELNEEEQFYAHGLSVLPTMQLEYGIFSTVSILLDLGVEFDPLNQTFRLKDNKDAIIEIPSGEVKPEWKGGRVSLGIKYSF
jgi:hypothetical protein